MVDRQPSFESVDLQGTTDHFNGTVGTSSAQLPASAGGAISELFIENISTSSSKTLRVSFDGGSNYKRILPKGGFLAWSVKGELTQIDIKGDVADVEYEVILNRETV